MISAVPPPSSRELVLLLYQSQTAVHPSPVITAGTSEEVEQQPLFGQSKMLMQEGADSVVFHILHSFKTFEK